MTLIIYICVCCQEGYADDGSMVGWTCDEGHDTCADCYFPKDDEDDEDFKCERCEELFKLKKLDVERVDACTQTE